MVFEAAMGGDSQVGGYHGAVLTLRRWCPEANRPSCACTKQGQKLQPETNKSGEKKKKTKKQCLLSGKRGDIGWEEKCHFQAAKKSVNI